MRTSPTSILVNSMIPLSLCPTLATPRSPWRVIAPNYGGYGLPYSMSTLDPPTLYQIYHLGGKYPQIHAFKLTLENVFSWPFWLFLSFQQPGEAVRASSVTNWPFLFIATGLVSPSAAISSVETYCKAESFQIPIYIRGRYGAYAPSWQGSVLSDVRRQSPHASGTVMAAEPRTPSRSC